VHELNKPLDVFGRSVRKYAVPEVKDVGRHIGTLTENLPRGSLHILPRSGEDLWVEVPLERYITTQELPRLWEGEAPIDTEAVHIEL
jgi:hypothetical protein